MYPITCPGGYNVPAKQGRFDVTGFCVTISDPTAAAEFAIVDDPEIKESWTTGRLLTTLTDQKGVLADVKVPASAGVGAIEWIPFETIKTRYGLSIYGTNYVVNSVCVYRR